MITAHRPIHRCTALAAAGLALSLSAIGCQGAPRHARATIGPSYSYVNDHEVLAEVGLWAELPAVGHEQVAIGSAE